MTSQTDADGMISAGKESGRRAASQRPAHDLETHHDPAVRLLACLDGVRQRGPGRWIARCPAHDDRHPSLGVRELDDGRLLVRCHAGCDIDAVLTAVGLDLSDLFPARIGGAVPRLPPERRPWLPSDVFDVARREVGVVAVIAADMAQSKAISQTDYERLFVAVGRLARIAEVAYGR